MWVVFIFYCLRQLRVTDPGELREPIYSPTGALVQPEVGEGWPNL